MQGTMNCNVKLLGTTLALTKGQRVTLLEATNLPARDDGRTVYFASPAHGDWSDGTPRDFDKSILLNPDDATPDA